MHTQPNLKVLEDAMEMLPFYFYIRFVERLTYALHKIKNDLY